MIQVRKDLCIRNLTEKDAIDVFETIDQNRTYLRKWLPWVDGTASHTTVAEVISFWEAERQNGSGEIYGIFLNDRYIGNIGLHDMKKPNRSGMIGYWLSQRYQGNGIMTDCVRVLINRGFYTLNLNRIYIHCATPNRKSRCIPERLGFTQEGVLQDGENLYGEYFDLVVYGLVKRNWFDSSGRNNCYLNAAHLYDLEQNDVSNADIPFYLDYAVRAKGKVLELACGTGRVSLKLAETGCQVTGLDLSESMLNVFYDKLAQAASDIRDRISLHSGSMSNFTLNEAFSLIIAPCRAFQALTEQGDIQNCLSCIREHLNDDGRFIINVFRPYKVLDESWCYPDTVRWTRDTKTGSHIVKKDRGEKIDTLRQIIYPSFTYEITEPGSDAVVLQEKLYLKYYYKDQLKSLLTDAGFRISEHFGWYDKSGIDSGRELIFVCGK